MIGTIETREKKISLDLISKEERPYSFRSPHIDLDTTLKAEILMLGLLHPIIIEEKETGEFIVLDGHRRLDAIREINEQENNWNEVPALVYSPEDLSLKDKFHLIYEKNVLGDKPYGAYDKSRFIKYFIQKGITSDEIMEAISLSREELTEYLILTQAPASLGPVLNHPQIQRGHGAWLVERYLDWMGTPYADQLEPVVQRLVHHLNAEKLSDNGWRFLLDFYWSHQRPFMAPFMKRRHPGPDPGSRK